MNSPMNRSQTEREGVLKGNGHYCKGPVNFSFYVFFTLADIDHMILKTCWGCMAAKHLECKQLQDYLYTKTKILIYTTV